jgi:hypothetical protein
MKKPLPEGWEVKQLQDVLTSEQIGDIVKLANSDQLNHKNILAVIKKDDSKYKGILIPEYLAYAVENAINEAE